MVIIYYILNYFLVVGAFLKKINKPIQYDQKCIWNKIKHISITTYNRNDGNIEVVNLEWATLFPWEIFFESNIKHFFFIYNCNVTGIYHDFILTTAKKSLLYPTLLLGKLNNIYTYVDTTCYNTFNHFVYLSTFSCLYSNNRISFIVNLNAANNLTLYSLSYIFLSSQWVERELKEFFNIFFINLQDTRRLLTDYTYTNKINYKKYKITNYDTVLQNLYY